MSVIKTNKGEEILVDDEDFWYLNYFTWHVSAKGYVVTHTSRKTGRKELRMHRILTECPKHLVVDHANMNKLDNRKSNLRVTTHQMNMANCKPRMNRHFKGVSPHHNKWRSVISYNGKLIHLGLFNTPEEAAKAYNDKATELFGEFARLNELEGANK